MRIIKLAAGRKINIRTTIDTKTGEMDVRIVDNPNGEGHDADLNEKLIADLMAAEVPGFGSFIQEDSGLTEVGYEERMKNITKPSPINVLNDPHAPVKPQTGHTPQQPIQQDQLDTGYGV